MQLFVIRFNEKIVSDAHKSFIILNTYNIYKERRAVELLVIEINYFVTQVIRQWNLINQSWSYYKDIIWVYRVNIYISVAIET